MLWKTLALLILRGYRLEGHFLGNDLFPPMFLHSSTKMLTQGAAKLPSQSTMGRASSSTTPGVINPKYEAWVTANQLLLSWLYNLMTSEVVV